MVHFLVNNLHAGAKDNSQTVHVLLTINRGIYLWGLVTHDKPQKLKILMLEITGTQNCMGMKRVIMSSYCTEWNL